MQADREIRAPVAGEIAKALIEPGEVALGQLALLSLYIVVPTAIALPLIRRKHRA